MKLENVNSLNNHYSTLQSTITAILKHEDCPQELYEQLSDFVVNSYNAASNHDKTLLMAGSLKTILRVLPKAA